MIFKIGYVLLFILAVTNLYFTINIDDYWIFGDIPNILILILMMMLSVSEYVYNKKKAS